MVIFNSYVKLPEGTSDFPFWFLALRSFDCPPVKPRRIGKAARRQGRTPQLRMAMGSEAAEMASRIFQWESVGMSGNHVMEKESNISWESALGWKKIKSICICIYNIYICNLNILRLWITCNSSISEKWKKDWKNQWLTGFVFVFCSAVWLFSE